ncbi:CAP domain-containing protein [Deinococcus aquaedulcis]|uniref:CAP domain-containing protein n=1 Tax=Deinococcus aquaedulcis TaxID=2840455 RepID=UPI001F351CD3|nr:CAP domain-containing protein [Deinococcus aquaedulcis]
MTVGLLSLGAAVWPGGAQASPEFRIGYRVSPERQAPLRVSFEASAPAGYVVQWVFGDGNQASGLSAEHVYYRPGTYTLQAQLLDPQGRVVSRAEAQLPVNSAGAERPALTVLQPTPGEVRLSAEGSVLYTPARPTLLLAGREVGTGASRVQNGTHAAVVRATTSDGRTVEKRLTIRVAPWTGSAAFDGEVLRLTNQARAQGYNCATNRTGAAALPPLRLDPTLTVAAQAQSAGMALYGYFDHTSSFDGSTPMRRVQAAGMTPLSVAENIAAGQQTPAEVVQGWLKSPGHCRNIMGDFTRIGLSYVNRPGTTYGRYWTQVFARI